MTKLKDLLNKLDPNLPGKWGTPGWLRDAYQGYAQLYQQHPYQQLKGASLIPLQNIPRHPSSYAPAGSYGWTKVDEQRALKRAQELIDQHGWEGAVLQCDKHLDRYKFGMDHQEWVRIAQLVEEAE